jgi:hypothetical protein
MTHFSVDIRDVSPDLVDRIRVWYRDYKIAEGHGPNNYGFCGQAQDKVKSARTYPMLAWALPCSLFVVVITLLFLFFKAFALKVIEDGHQQWLSYMATNRGTLSQS